MAIPDPTPVALTGNPNIDGLLEPSNWVDSTSTLVFTWSHHNGGGAWTGTELTYVQKAFDAWAAVADIRFSHVTGPVAFTSATADMAVVATGLRLGETEDADGLAFTPDPLYTNFELMGVSYTSGNYPRSQGDIFIDDALNGSFIPRGYGFHVLLHEIGHALGLKHPHDVLGSKTFAALGIAAKDNNYWTVMSYNNPQGEFPAFSSGWAVTPMPLDILAVQHLYGANMTYHTGDDTYSLGLTTSYSTIWDAGGTDTLDAALYTGGGTLNISLNPGAFNFHGPHSMTAIAYNVTIENVIGSGGNDRIVGNGAENYISAGVGHDNVGTLDGNDIVEGGRGRDTLNGGTGDDQLAGGSNADVLEGGPGRDTLVGGSGRDVLRGEKGADNLDGGPLADELSGGVAKDVLDGGLDADILAGGSGGDTFVFDTVPGALNVDQIMDFEEAGNVALDVIRLDRVVFASLPASGALADGDFVSGVNPVAGDPNDFILYDTSSGALFYDADGNGGGAAIQFAVLVTSPDALNASDFTVI